MRISTDKWPITTTHQMRHNINLHPDYQRRPAWTVAQQQLLIDSILRGFDVPKLYFRQTSVDGDSYEAIDGQQRLTAIWAFMDDKLTFPKDAEDIKGIKVAGKRYSEIGSKLTIEFCKYNLDVATVYDATEDEVREMFQRLQNGTTLKAQERRNAMVGNMRDYVCMVEKHPFFMSVPFKDTRYAHQHIAAQMCLLSMKGSICNIKNRDLNLMYDENREFNEDSAQAKRVLKILNYLQRMFPNKTPELKRFNVISMFALVSELIDRYAIFEREAELAKWFLDFEYRRDLDKQSENRNTTLVEYEAATSHSSDGVESLKFRHDVLMADLLEHIPNLENKDPQRSFDEVQRRLIYRRDGGVCKKCDRKCEWDGEWHADHVIPWVAGGKTTLENGQVLCAECNLKKSAHQ